MVEKIYEAKNKILEHVSKQLEERGVENVNVNQLGMMVDMVKDLAEAEKECWEAQYYRTVTEAMGQKSGYSGGQGGGTGSSAGYGSQGGQGGGGRSGYMQSTARQGYGTGMSGHQEVKELVRKMQMADPMEKEHIIQELRSEIGM